MTVNEITTNIAKEVGRELDFTFKRSLLVTINGWRSTLIKQTVDRTPTDRKFFTSSLFFEVEKITTYEGVTLNCPIWRTKKSVPKPLRAAGVTYDYLGSIDGATPFGTFSFGTLQYISAGSLWRKPRYFEESGRVYTDKYVKGIRINAIWDDPEVAYNCGCDTGDCDFWNSEYPLPNEIAQKIVQSILTVEFRRPPMDKNQEITVNQEDI